MSRHRYATSKFLPPIEDWETRIFIRDDGYFYSIALPVDDDLDLHAELNPGTVRVEDVHGNILWPEGMLQ